jgi:hypothetical protein
MSEEFVIPVDTPVESATASVDPERGTDKGIVPSYSSAAAVEVVEAPRPPKTTPAILDFKDHFTLPIPSSVIRYRESHSAARVIEGQNSQFVLEETYDAKEDKHGVSIRKIHNSSEGVKVLRLSYAIVTAFWTGFLFIFCLQILLFLVLDLAIEVGATSQQQDANIGAALGVIFSIVPFVYGLASSLVIAGAFIVDTWRGHFLIRNFTLRGWSPVVVEWIFFAFFLGLPLLVMGVTLLAQIDIWWTITSLFWFSTVAAFFVIFTANVIFYEMRACWEVTRNRYDDDIDSYFELITKSILLRQVSRYSGRKTVKSLCMGSIQDTEATDKGMSGRNVLESTKTEQLDLKARITNWKFFTTLGLYQKLETPERVYSVDDARDVRPYVTSYTWSLEKIFCRAQDSRYIAIVKGPGAVTRAQMRSSFICSLIGNFLIFLIILALLVWVQLDAATTCFLLAVAFLVFLPGFRTTYRLFGVTKELVLARTNAKNRNDDDEAESGEMDSPIVLTAESEGLYQYIETYRVNRATNRMCWIMFSLEVTFFFVWPLVSLLVVENYPLAGLFLIVAGITGVRYYVNAAIVLEETGHMDLVDGQTEHELWKNQSRLNEIVGNITRGRSRGAWMSILGGFGFIFVALFAGAVGTETEKDAETLQTGDTAETTSYNFLPDFAYQQADSLRYPTCELTNAKGESPLNSMADFAFLAGLAYSNEASTQDSLDGWFGPSGMQATDREDVVEEWRNVNKIESSVSFKLVTFPDPDAGDFAYVLIRGTQNNWDMLTDVQLWGAAALMQALRALLPLGEMWTPIMAQLIQLINTIESTSIERVSFYKTTTKFVNYLKNETDYRGVGITGHSLGGGLAIISGAQTATPAVALSGPNTMLTRRSLDPPISSEALDSQTFNIIPERDVVPMLDDVAQDFQRIRCNTGANDVIGCHDSTRSLCEIIYSCGTQGRPALCECVGVTVGDEPGFGYPEPEPILNADGTQTRTFAEACPGK